MKKALLLAFLLLTGCVSQNSANAPLTTTEIKQLIVPGSTTYTHTFKWPSQSSPTQELESITDSLKTPQDVATFLQKNYEWKDDYDTTEFLTPNMLVAQKRGVCTAFARFWQYWNLKQGRRSTFLAFWGPTSAHAVTIFIGPDNKWHMGSNQYYHVSEDLAPGVSTYDGLYTAGINAAKYFYGPKWSLIQFYDENGRVFEVMENKEVSGALIPGALDARKLFVIKDM